MSTESNEAKDNLWNTASRIIKIGDLYELSVYDDRGHQIAIAVGRTEDGCRKNATIIIEAFGLGVCNDSG